MSKLKDENYFQIGGWMINRLGLKGNALLVYAVIFGFSQDGETEFTGSRQYICDITGVSKPTVDKILLELQQQGLIEKNSETRNGITFNRYKVILDFTTDKATLQGDKTALGGGKATLPNNNIYNNNYNNKENNISKDIFKENNKNEKHKYGEYGRVLLTDEQYQRLVEEYDKVFIDDVIAKVDAYVESNNNKNHYSNFYAVIKNAINGKWFNIKEYTKPKPITTLEESDEAEQEHITIRAKNYFENLYNTDRDKYYNELGKLQMKNPALASYVVNQVENGGFEEL